MRYEPGGHRRSNLESASPVRCLSPAQACLLRSPRGAAAWPAPVTLPASLIVLEGCAGQGTGGRGPQVGVQGRCHEGCMAPRGRQRRRGLAACRGLRTPVLLGTKAWHALGAPQGSSNAAMRHRIPDVRGLPQGPMICWGPWRPRHSFILPRAPPTLHHRAPARSWLHSRAGAPPASSFELRSAEAAAPAALAGAARRLQRTCRRHHARCSRRLESRSL